MTLPLAPRLAFGWFFTAKQKLIDFNINTMRFCSHFTFRGKAPRNR
jgi:hypothetical protein